MGADVREPLIARTPLALRLNISHQAREVYVPEMFRAISIPAPISVKTAPMPPKIVGNNQRLMNVSITASEGV